MEKTESTLQSSTHKDIQLNEESIHSLTEIRKWTNFFGILGIIALVFMLLAGIIMVLVLPFLNETGPATSFSPLISGILYLFFSALYILPILFLLRFTKALRRALGSADEHLMGIAMKNLALHFRTVGIITIGFIVLYIALIVVLFVMGLGMFAGSSLFI